MLKTPNKRYVSYRNKMCISDCHNRATLSTIPSTQYNFLFFLFQGIFMSEHAHIHSHNILFLFIWAIHQNNVWADLTWITCRECSFLPVIKDAQFPLGQWNVNMNLNESCLSIVCLNVCVYSYIWNCVCACMHTLHMCECVCVCETLLGGWMAVIQ